MRRNTLPILLAAATLAAAPVFLRPALSAPAVVVDLSAAGAKLSVRGRLIAIFRTPNGSLSPEQRADLAASRLETLIEDGLAADAVEARANRAKWGVYAVGTLVMVATEEEAAKRHEDPETTARRWAANLRKALGGAETDDAAKVRSAGTGRRKAGARAAAAVPKPRKEKPNPAPTLAIDESDLAVPAGETRTVAVKGTATGPIAASTDDQQTAVVAPVAGRPALRIGGLAPGRAIIHVERGGKSADFTVWVKQYAGRLGAIPQARVTGTQAPASLVRRMAEAVALEGVEKEPGAVVRVTGPATGVQPLARGETVEVSFPITISGEAYLTVKALARVSVVNVPLPPEEATLLLYSNDPESVKEYGTLYDGMIGNDGPVRLLYHHQNKVRRPMLFQMHLVNPSDAPTDVQVIEGDAGPFVDPVQVGHRAAQRYLTNLTQDLGCILRVPARSSVAVYTCRVENEDCVSGIYNFRVVDGSPLVVHISAAGEPSTPSPSDSMVALARAQPHTYDTPQLEESYSYKVGDRWTFVPIGRKAIVGRNSTQKLFGNYGVLYDITLDLENPSADGKPVRVVMAPEAGWARGVFIVEGKLVEVQQVAPPSEAVLWTGRLGPGERRRLKIQGIPVGGSSYPVSIVVRP
jgi:hypothetical protein